MLRTFGKVSDVQSILNLISIRLASSITLVVEPRCRVKRRSGRANVVIVGSAHGLFVGTARAQHMVHKNLEKRGERGGGGGQSTTRTTQNNT